MRDFEGKTAFITGGGSGFGLELGKALAARGTRVMLADINAAALDAAKASLESGGAMIQTIVCDVTDRASVERAATVTASAFGPVHLLFNNAGVVTAGATDRLAASDWEWVFAVNVFGTANGIAAFLPAMRAHGEAARVINTSSIAGLKGFPNSGAYCASKAAIVTLSEALRDELVGTQVGVTVLCPGWMRTGFFSAGDRRQDRFGGPKSTWAAANEATQALLLDEMEAGLEPGEIAALALRAIIDNRFIVVTHAKDRAMVSTRNGDVIAAYDWLDQRQAERVN